MKSGQYSTSWLRGLLVLTLGVLLGALLPTWAGGGAAPAASAPSPTRTAVSTLSADDLAAALAPSVLSGRLTGQRVTVLALPGVIAATTSRAELSQIQLTAMLTSLRQAGVGLGPTLQVLPSWTDPARLGVLVRLSEALAPSGVPTSARGEPARRADAVLASALLGRSAAGALPDPARATLLAGLSRGEFLAPLISSTAAASPRPGGIAPGLPGARGTVLLLLAPCGSATSSVVNGWVHLVDALAATGPVLVACPGISARSGLLATLRAVKPADVRSTLDGGASAVGRFTMVLALAELMRGGEGDYGPTGVALLPGAAQRSGGPGRPTTATSAAPTSG